MEELAYSPKQFCKVAGFSLSRLYKSWREGTGPDYFKLGKRTVIPGESARQWLQQRAEVARAERAHSAVRAPKCNAGRDTRSSRKRAPTASEATA
jgi:predicted DNA-binding transcriptional regulator AlpA